MAVTSVSEIVSDYDLASSGPIRVFRSMTVDGARERQSRNRRMYVFQLTLHWLAGKIPLLSRQCFPLMPTGMGDLSEFILGPVNPVELCNYPICEG